METSTESERPARANSFIVRRDPTSSKDFCRCFVFALPSWYQRKDFTPFFGRSTEETLGLVYFKYCDRILPPQFSDFSVAPFTRPCVVNLAPDTVSLKVFYMREDLYITTVPPRHGIVLDCPRRGECGAVVVVAAKEKAFMYAGFSLFDFAYPTADLVNDILRGEKVSLYNVLGSNDFFRIDPFTWKSAAKSTKMQPSTVFPNVSYLGDADDVKLLKFLDDNRALVTEPTSLNLLCKKFLVHVPISDEAPDSSTETTMIRLPKIDMKNYAKWNPMFRNEIAFYKPW